ncbi:MAG: hypothetical protein HKO93_02595, partial [Flavobacteriales bacterium]|nr:hypothetical protein [Flavobacteriales bacterium]
YRQAQNYMDAGDFRAAYKVYTNIVKRDSDYKESKERMAVAREMGTFVMAIMPVENKSNLDDIESKIEAYLVNSLIGLQNPFLKIVDRQHLDEIIAQQDFSLSGVISDASAIEVGNLTGAEGILVGQVIDIRAQKGRPTKLTKKGYESYLVTVKGENGEEEKKTRYRPVTFYEHTNRNSVYISFHVKLLHLETSEVLVSEVIERELSDEVNWVSYSGNVNKLFPEKNDKPLTSRSAVNNLRSMIDARTDLASIEELLNQSYNKIGSSISSRVDDYLQ